MASLPRFPLLQCLLFSLNQLCQGSKQILWTKTSPADGASRSSPACGRNTFAEYGHSLILFLPARWSWLSGPQWDSLLPSPWPGPAPLFRLMVPYSASMTISPPGCTGCHCCQGTVFRRVFVALRLIEFSCRTCRGNPKGIDCNNLFGLRVIDQRLCLASPAEYVPHCAGGCQHRAGGIYGVTAAVKDHRPCRGGKGFAGDGHPVLPCSGGFWVVTGNVLNDCAFVMTNRLNKLKERNIFFIAVSIQFTGKRLPVTSAIS
jgi:hypothetical protein